MDEGEAVVGCGRRWRDVKLRAFEQAKHRTYVDLKVGRIGFCGGG